MLSHRYPSLKLTFSHPKNGWLEDVGLSFLGSGDLLFSGAKMSVTGIPEINGHYGHQLRAANLQGLKNSLHLGCRKADCPAVPSSPKKRNHEKLMDLMSFPTCGSKAPDGKRPERFNLMCFNKGVKNYRSAPVASNFSLSLSLSLCLTRCFV